MASLCAAFSAVSESLAHLQRFRRKVDFRTASDESRFQIGHAAFEFPSALDVAQDVANLLRVCTALEGSQRPRVASLRPPSQSRHKR